MTMDILGTHELSQMHDWEDKCDCDQPCQYWMDEHAFRCPECGAQAHPNNDGPFACYDQTCRWEGSMDEVMIDGWEGGIPY